jgi:hypothetical protein
VFDIKPYVAYTDAIPTAGAGWLGDVAAPPDPVPAFAVDWNAAAAEQAAWIEARTGLALRERVSATLALGPQPHPYRRIRRVGNDFVLAVRDWRVSFAAAEKSLRVLRVASGYRAAQLARVDASDALDAHREFRARWPGE